MQNPEVILGILEKNAKRKGFRHEKLYKLMYNKELYIDAYTKLAPKQSNLTKGQDGKTIDGFSLTMIDEIIEQMRDESYQPTPTKRTYIPKRNGKKRPLGIPSFKDKLVQEVIRIILDSMYEINFTDTSHGFRPNRSPHTALKQLVNRGTGIKWWVEGDIEGFFDNINHHILIKLLRKRINDERFLRLIWKFLRAGYVENWVFNKTYSGSPQGSIISPILSNVYLNELDTLMEKIKESFDKGKHKRMNIEYRKYQARIYTTRKKLENKEYKSEEEKERLIGKIEENTKIMRTLPSRNEMDQNFKRLIYVRYADDFLVGIIGSKKDAIEIREHIKNYLEKELDLKLSMEKTKITNSKKAVRFLGYDLIVTRNTSYKKVVKNENKTQRHLAHTLQLLMPHEKVKEFLVKTRSIYIKKDGTWKARPRPSLIHNDNLEITLTFNAEIRGLYNYYALANNVSNLNNAFGLFRQSYLKTLGTKYKTSINNLRKKKGLDGIYVNGEWGAKYVNSKGEIKFIKFYNDGFSRNSNTTNNVDTLPSDIRNTFRTSLTSRLRKNRCEGCGDTESTMEVHHVRKLKDVKNKARKNKYELRMIERNRKTIVLCNKCHRDLHDGKL